MNILSKNRIRSKTKKQILIYLMTSLALTGSPLFSKDQNTLSKTITNGSNQFACNLYRNLGSSHENILFSPYSISNALSMTYIGAKGTTKEEMAQTLFASKPVKKNLLEGIKNLQNYYSNLHTDSCEFNIANKLFVDKGFTLKEIFQEKLNASFGATIESVDFNNAQLSASIINEWISDATKEKIKNAIPKEFIQPGFTKLALVNAIYFKATWKKQFNQEMTTKKLFFSDGNYINNTIEENPYCNEVTGDCNFDLSPDYNQTAIDGSYVDMMQQTTNLNYVENDFVQMVELPYKNSSLSMFIMLPTEQSGGLHNVEHLLTEKFISELIVQMKKHQVRLNLPKFKIESTYNKLKETLKNIGIQSAFSSAANFSGISEEQLHISDVIHKAFIEVEESGTEAAAATIVLMNKCLTPFKLPLLEKIFNTNHPFIFFIRDKKTHQIIFMGRIEKI